MYLFCCEDSEPHCWLEKDLDDGKKKYLEENDIDDEKIFEYSDPIMISGYSSMDTVYYTKLYEYKDEPEVWILELIYSGRTNIYYEYSLEEMLKLVHQLYSSSVRRVRKKDVEFMNKSLLESGTYEIPDKLLSEDEEDNYHHFTLYKILKKITY
jgi:hypothetical protein